MNFNSFSYPSRRTVVFAKNGMAATGTPQAAEAGIEIMRKGGNAIDAIVAMAMCLTVVEPTSNGIGSDAFAIVYTKDKLYGLNASGWAASKISAEIMRQKGYTAMPAFGFESVTVPGAPSAWAALSSRFGRLSLDKIAEPAVNYAAEGYPVSAITSQGWKGAYNSYSSNCPEDKFKPWFDTFAKGGKTPEAGEIWADKEMAATLREIALTNAESFYRGELMEKIVKFSDDFGGYFTKDDFIDYKPEWVEPVSVNYRGYDVYELPPNGQGITALTALNIISNFDLDNTRETARNYHLQIEAMKLAFADSLIHVADSKYMKISVKDLLSKEYAKERSTLITDRAQIFTHGEPKGSGTVYLCAADSEGNMVSYIQSNYMGFGSGLCVPETGIALHNRGNGFSLNPNHVNELHPRKRPYHTIIPGFLMKDGKPVGPFGVMGGFMQPQGHLQMMLNTVDFDMNPQDALDAPRWQWLREKNIDLESFVNNDIASKLSDMGHNIRLLDNYGSMGRGQIIWRLENGTLCGGTEPRTDGTISIW